MLKAIGQSLVDFMSQMIPLHTYQYCQVATPARFDDRKTFSTVDGGYISAIKISGLNKVIGQQEIRDAHALYETLVRVMVANTNGAHELDIEQYVNPHDTEGYLQEHTVSQMASAERIGFDLADQFAESNKVMAQHINYEHCVLYIKTMPSAQRDLKKNIKRVKEAFNDMRKTNIRFNESQVAWLYSEDLFDTHNAAIELVNGMFNQAKFTTEILEIPEFSGMMASSTRRRRVAPFQPKLWDDKPRIKYTLDESPDSPNLTNLGYTNFGMQLMLDDILETKSAGIVKIGDIYVAPVLIETIPDEKVSVNALQQSLPLYMPFSYRIHITRKETLSQGMAKALAPFLSFSKKWLMHNRLISDGFRAVLDMVQGGTPIVNASIITTTWAYSEREAKKLQSELIAKISAWGNATSMLERGDPIEAAISSIGGFAMTNRAPYTLMSAAEAARLAMVTRPADPIDDAVTLCYHPSGKPVGLSPISRHMEAFIEIDIAPSGSGKSVLQNTINRDMNFTPGRRKLTRHVTIDIGPSGKGTVKSLQDSLPDNMKHELVYEKVILDPSRAINPMDLPLGMKRPTPLDLGNICDLIKILATPDHHNISPMMSEMIQLVVARAYEDCADPDEAKLYSRGRNIEIDDELSKYPEAQDEDYWGARQTWWKIRDFFFKKGNNRLASIASRYAVPLVSDLPGYALKDATVTARFGKGDNNLVDEFQSLISVALNKYKILSSPTMVDYSDARYVVLDLNDVTQSQGSSQTAFMYGLVAHVALRNYWLNSDVLEHFDEPYQHYARDLIEDLREEKLGVTFEEFRRTEGQTNIRNMISRFMAEGRKWGIMVRVVAQLPSHLNKEMIQHATMLNLMGSWKPGMVADLMEHIELTESEIEVLLHGGTHGPKRGGPAFIVKYQLKTFGGWCGQLVRLAKSPYELWATSTTQEDMQMRDTMEELVLNTKLAREILTHRWPSGSAIDSIRAEKKRLSSTASQNSDVMGDLAKKSIESWKLMYRKDVA